MTLKTLREDLLEAENDLQHAWDSHQIELCEKAIDEIKEEIHNYMEKYQYEDGQLVKFDLGVMSGTGKVVGVASNENIFGATYIVEVESSNIEFPNSTYPFKVIAIPQIFITETFSQ